LNKNDNNPENTSFKTSMKEKIWGTSDYDSSISPSKKFAAQGNTPPDKK